MLKGSKCSEETRRKMSEAKRGEKHPNFGKKFSPSTLKKMSEAKKGKNHPWFGKHLPLSTREKIRKASSGQGNGMWGKHLSAEARRKIGDGSRGAKSHFWKGGITPAHIIARTSPEYKKWRDAVYARDGYLCVIGGKDHGNELQADHIKPFSLFPELRFVIENGRTLCVDCHKKTDTYAGKMFKYAK